LELPGYTGDEGKPEPAEEIKAVDAEKGIYEIGGVATIE
jgi:hypothetical protein